MRFRLNGRRLGIVLAVGVAGCSSSPSGRSNPGSAGSGGSAGAQGAAGAAGSVGTGGSSSGGTSGAGGTSSSGGAGSGGAGGAQTGGVGGTATGSGGVADAGAGTGGGSDAGGAGGNMSGNCQKGKTKGADVVIMGESFYAIAPQYIQNRIQDDARKAGSLGANDTYRNVAVSGQNMNYIATAEWTAATQGGAMFKYVIMDGGGIDCLTGSACPTCASTFKTLLGKMAAAGVQDVIYTRYPEPGNPPGSNASLKACLDSTMPMIQTTCEGSTSPRCHWVDLRPVWVNGDTSDGLHPTPSGGDHVGDLIWSEMVKLCFAQ